MGAVKEGLFAEYQPGREGARSAKDWEVRLARPEDAWGIAAVVQEREGGDLDEMRAHAGRELAAIADGAEDALWVGERGGEIVAFAREYGGLAYARQRARGYADRALELLDDFEPSPTRQTLHDAVEYVLQRTH